MLQRAWRLPLRKLVLAMPMTARARRLAAHALTDLSWTESFLLGALLSPTDPVLSSSVVTNPRVPRLIRHSLNLESGLNDGLALPAVLALRAALATDEGDFVWWRVRPPGRRRSGSPSASRSASSASADAARRGARAGSRAPEVAVRARRRVRDLRRRGRCRPSGNGFIAVFVCAITLGHPPPRPPRALRGALRGHRRDRQARDLRRVRVAADLRRPVRGRLGGRGDRRVHAAAWRARSRSSIALAGTRLDTADARRFMAWFGPKGVATMTFSLLVLGRGDRRGRADLQHRRAGGVLLDHRPRADGHAGLGVARTARRRLTRGGGPWRVHRMVKAPRTRRLATDATRRGGPARRACGRPWWRTARAARAPPGCRSRRGGRSA